MNSIEKNLTHFAKYESEYLTQKDNNCFLIKMIIGINKLNLIERLFVYLSFFGVFIMVIFIMSKCNKNFSLIKKRHQQYGFYINQKYEQRLSQLNQNILLTITKIFQRRFKLNENKKVLSTKPYSKLDIGHINEIFEIENFDSNFELPSIEITEFIKDNNVSNEINENVSIKTGEFSFLKKYLNKKKVNSFSYNRLKSKGYDAASPNSFERSSKNSLSLLSNNDSNASSNFLKNNFSMSKIFFPKNKSKTLLMETESSSLYSSSLQLPIILITDTSSMHTSIIDLENFEPDDFKNKISSSQSLLNYYFQDESARKY